MAKDTYELFPRLLETVAYDAALAHPEDSLSRLIESQKYDVRLVGWEGEIGSRLEKAEIIVNPVAGLVFVVGGRNFVATIQVPPEQTMDFAVLAVAGNLTERGIPVKLKRHGAVVRIWPRASTPESAGGLLNNIRGNN